MRTRLLGAAVLLALLVLFVPMFFPGNSPTGAGDHAVSLAIPAAPDRDMQTKTLSLDMDGAAPAASSVPAKPVNPTSPVIPSTPASGGDRLSTAEVASAKPPEVTPKAESKPQPAKASPAAPAPTQPEPQPQSAAPAAATAGGSYRLNLSAYSSDSGAQALMRKVRALGYPVSERSIRQRGKTLTLVTGGPFETRTAAEAARQKIIHAIPGVPARVEADAGATSGAAAARSRSQAPAPAAAAPAKAGGWAVQLAAMSDRTDADALRDKLRAKGFDGFVDSVTSGGKTLWRVRAGPQLKQADAEQVRGQIKSRLGISGLVVRVP